MAINKIKKQITFSNQMIEHAEKKASNLGLDFPEYVRYLVTKDIEITTLPSYTPNKKEIEKWNAALDDIKKGNVVGPFKSPKELDDYLDSL